MRPHDHIDNPELGDELFGLADVEVRVQLVPRTDLVHLDLGGRGLVMSRAQASRVGRDLLTTAGSRRYAAAATAPAAAAVPRSPRQRP